MIRIPKVISRLFTSAPSTEKVESPEQSKVKHKGRTWKKNFKNYIQKTLIFLRIKRSEKKESKLDLKSKNVVELVRKYDAGTTPEVHPEKEDKSLEGKVLDLADSVTRIAGNAAGTGTKFVFVDLPITIGKDIGIGTDKKEEPKEINKRIVHPFKEMKKNGEAHLANVKNQKELIKLVRGNDELMATFSKSEVDFLKDWNKKFKKYLELNTEAEKELNAIIDPLLQDPPEFENFDKIIKNLEKYFKRGETFKKYSAAEKGLFLQFAEMEDFSVKHKDQLKDFLSFKGPSAKNVINDFMPHQFPNQRSQRVVMPVKEIADLAEKEDSGVSDSAKRRLAAIISNLQTRSTDLNELRRKIDSENLQKEIDRFYEEFETKPTPQVISTLVNLLQATTLPPPIILNKEDITDKVKNVIGFDARLRIKNLNDTLGSRRKAKKQQETIEADWKVLQHYHKHYPDSIDKTDYQRIENLFKKRFPR